MNAFKNYVQINAALGQDFPILHCPFCGEASTEVNDNEADVTPCEHLQFVFLSEIADFEFQTDAFAQRWQNLDSEDCDLSEFATCLAQAGFDDQLIAFEISHATQGHGTPRTHRYIYGFAHHLPQSLSP
jgi:hypothetical protein